MHISQRSVELQPVGVYTIEHCLSNTSWAQVRICCRAFKILVEEVGFDPQDVIFDPNILTVGTGLAEHNNYAVDFFE